MAIKGTTHYDMKNVRQNMYLSSNQVTIRQEDSRRTAVIMTERVPLTRRKHMQHVCEVIVIERSSLLYKSLKT